jgi:hypothetical protein
MRRGFLALLLVLPFIATASAQSPAPRIAPVLPQPVVQPFRVVPPALAASASLGAVVDRMMVFDRNHDGRVAKDELLERMQSLVVRGDADGDGALDDAEIRSLATTRPAATIRGGIQPGSYGFADQTGLSTSSHIEDSIDDLRLPAATRDQALAVVKSFMVSLHLSAGATLQKKMASLLSEEQLTNFKLLLDRQRTSGVAAFPVPQAPNMRNVRMFVLGNDLERRVASYKLAPTALREAQLAIQDYRSSLRLGETERQALMVQLTGILDNEERDNLLAALQRRPVVKTGTTHVVNVAAGPRVETAIVQFRTLPAAAAKPDFHFLLTTQKTAVLVPADAR